MKHKHADILQAIAEDKDVKIEFHYSADRPWVSVDRVTVFHAVANEWPVEYRIAPKTIKIGDVDVPEPMQVAPALGTKYWFIDFYGAKIVAPFFWNADTTDNRLLKFGVCHLTEAAAREHAEAIIKVSGGVL